MDLYDTRRTLIVVQDLLGHSLIDSQGSVRFQNFHVSHRRALRWSYLSRLSRSFTRDSVILALRLPKRRMASVSESRRDKYLSTFYTVYIKL